MTQFSCLETSRAPWLWN